MEPSHTQEELRQRVHPGCVACSPTNGRGLGLRFSPTSDGGIRAEFTSEADLEGYPGVLHGGITSLIFDSAMVNCLFALGHQAVTAELTVRFLSPVSTGLPLQVEARLKSDMHPLYVVEATLSQAGAPRARAQGKFMAV
ncbi:MAG: PaaI family thioesterase [Deltaproteobacteria bacterium]|nr:PaaI family thioesterase [Deltaproteobacteria bacterium]